MPELTRLLQDPDPAVIDAAAAGLLRLGPSAAPALSALVDAIRRSEIDCRSSDTLADAVVAIEPPVAILHFWLDPIEPELRRLIMMSLEAARARLDGARSSSDGADASG